MNAPLSKKKLAFVLVLVALASITAWLLLRDLNELADAFPHGDPGCVETLADGSVYLDPGCVNGKRIPKLPPQPSR